MAESHAHAEAKAPHKVAPPARNEAMGPWRMLLCSELGREETLPRDINAANRDSFPEPSGDETRGAAIALRHLTGIAGDSGGCTLRVCSGSRAFMERSLAAILETCARSDSVPDLLLWDYPVYITMAHMKALARVLSHAAARHVMVLASLAADEALVQAARTQSSIRSLLLTADMAPLRHVRRNPAARVLCLCAPAITVESSEGPAAHCGAAWLIAHELLHLLVDGGSPLKQTVPSGEELERSFQFSIDAKRIIDPEVVGEAHRAGVVLLSDRNPHILPLCTLANPDMCGEQASLFGYQLLQSRLQRLIERFSRTMALHLSDAEVAGELKRYLLSVSGPLHLVSSERGIRTGSTANTLWADIVADNTADMPPMHIHVEI